MPDTIKNVDIEDVGNNNALKSMKNYTTSSITNDVIEDFNFDLFDGNSELTGVDINGGIRLDGRFVDDSGKSFDARYYYSADGAYNVSYKDGYKDVTIKLNVDGTMMNSEVNYKDSVSKTEVKEIINYNARGGMEKSVYKDGKLSSKEITDRDGTVTTMQYNDEVTGGKKSKPADFSKETIIKYDSNNVKMEELNESKGIILEEINYLNDDFG